MSFMPVGNGGGQAKKGRPGARPENLRIATEHAKKRLLATNGDYYALRSYLKNWLAGRYGLSRTTIADYLVVIEARLRQDPDVKAAGFGKQGASQGVL